MVNLKPARVNAVARSWVVCAMTIGIPLACPGTGLAQQLDDSCTVTVNGQTVQVNADGTFVVPNVAAADLFGAGGPGTPPDFLSDDFLRLTGVCTGGAAPLYVTSECFRIRRGQSFQVGSLTFSDDPPQTLTSIRAAPVAPTLTTLGQQTPINLTGLFTDGSSGPLAAGVYCPATFRTSNAGVVSVTPSASNPHQGIASARGIGTALITGSVEGAISVTSVTVSLGDPLTTVTGIVHTPEGDPVDGALVRFAVNGAVIAGTGVTGGSGQAPGQFIVSGVASRLGPISAYATATVGGSPRSGVSVLKTAVPAGFTDAGLITLDNRVFWINNADGPWTTPTNWVSGVLPTIDQIAVINVPANITVTLQLGGSQSVRTAGLECSENFNFLQGGLTLSGPSVFNAAYTATVNAFLNGTGTVTFNGPVALSGGTLGSNVAGGAITFNAGLTTAGASISQLFARTFTNANNGTIAITGTGGLSRGFLAVFNNLQGSLFDFRSDGDSPESGFPTGTVFNNAGTIRKSAGTAVSAVGGTFNNTGVVEVQTGTLQLPGGTSPGSFTVSPGAALEFATTLQIPQNVSGLVSVPVGGALRFFGFLSSVNFTGPTQIAGQIVTGNGTGNFNAVASAGVAASSLGISGVGAGTGALVFAGNVTTGSVSLGSQGILAGAGSITVNGPFDWTAGDLGSLSAAGSTILNGGMILSGTGFRQLIARTLTNSNNGSIVWTGGGLTVSAGSVINNPTGSTFDIQTENDLNGGSGVNVLNNAGTFRKSAGTANSTIVSINVQNTGLIEAVAGTIEFPSSNTYIQTSGSTVLAGGAISRSGVSTPLQINGGSFGLSAGTAAGTVSGSVTLNGASAVTVPRAGAAGTLTITGAYTQTAGVLDIELGGIQPGVGHDVLVVGTAQLGGTLRLTLIDGFVPNVGQQFTVLTGGSLSGTFGNVSLINFPANLSANVSYSATAVTVTITSG